MTKTKYSVNWTALSPHSKCCLCRYDWATHQRVVVGKDGKQHLGGNKYCQDCSADLDGEFAECWPKKTSSITGVLEFWPEGWRDGAPMPDEEVFWPTNDGRGRLNKPRRLWTEEDHRYAQATRKHERFKYETRRSIAVRKTSTA